METLERAVSELTNTVHELERRLAAMERRVEHLPDEIETADEGRDTLLPDFGGDHESELALAGRTLLVLGGAYLLRAITDGGILPRPLGVALGLLYAAVWLIASHRAILGGARLSATVHSLAAALIAYPLLFEATHRFEVLHAWVGIALLAAVTAAGLAVASRHGLRANAWVAVGGALVASVLMLASTEAVVAYSFFFTALGIAALWLSYVHDWIFLRWPPAVLANLVIALVTIMAIRGDAGVGGAEAIAAQLFLFTMYVGSFAIRTLALGRHVIPFEIGQTVMALLLGAGGAAWVSRSAPGVHLALGSGLFALGVAAYAVAFAFVEKREGIGRNFFFYGGVALVLALAGPALLFSPVVLAITWAASGIAAALLADRLGKRTLAFHAAAYAGAALATAGTFWVAIAALALPPQRPWGGVGWEDVAVVTATGAAFWLIGRRDAVMQERALGARMALLSMFVLTAAGLVLHLVIGTLGIEDAGACATIRTALLSVAAVLLAMAGHHRRMPEASQLVYPLLVAVAVKLTIEDMRVGRPVTLFLAFAIYGGALIVAPRLRRRRRAPAADVLPGVV